MSNEKLNEWLAVNLMGWRYDDATGQLWHNGELVHDQLNGRKGVTLLAIIKYRYHEIPDYAGTYDGMGLVIEALHARKDTTYLIDMSSEWANGGKLVWRVNVCTPRNSYCWRDAYGPLWESLPLGVAESVKKAIELERAGAAQKASAK